MLQGIDIKASHKHTDVMRTTLTVDSDVAQQIEHLQRVTGRTHKQVINELLRAGLSRRRATHGRANKPVPPTDPVACGGFLVPLDQFASTGSLLADLDRLDREANTDSR